MISAKLIVYIEAGTSESACLYSIVFVAKFCGLTEKNKRKCLGRELLAPSCHLEAPKRAVLCCALVEPSVGAKGRDFWTFVPNACEKIARGGKFCLGSPKNESANSSLPQEEPPGGKRRLLCHECGYATVWYSNFKHHQMTHTGERPFQCRQCSQAFRQKEHLERHIRTHTGEKPYQCTYCNQTFARESVLTQHLRTHTGERPYKCNLCPMTFTCSGNLQRHVRNHKQEKPFACRFCSVSFSCIDRLKHHEQKVHLMSPNVS